MSFFTLFFDDFLLSGIILMAIFFIFRAFSAPSGEIPTPAASSINSATASARRSVRVSSDSLDCAICLDQSAFAVETNCSHCFCAACFIHLSKHSAASSTSVRCPCCRRSVTFLMEIWSDEERALLDRPVGNDRRNSFDYNREAPQTPAVAHSLFAGIHRFNSFQSRSLFSGPANVFEAVRDTPALMRRLFSEAASSGRGLITLVIRMKIILSFLFGFVYLIFPFDFLPDVLFPLFGYFDDFLVLVAVGVYTTQVYRGILVERDQNRMDSMARNISPQERENPR